MRREDVIALNVKGDSMKDAGILSGDMVFAKRQPFAVAEFGIVGLETLLPLSLGLLHGGKLELPQVLGLLSNRPADILKLGAGRLQRGLPADLVLIDVEQPWRVDALAFRSKSKNSPFDGFPVQGKVLQTVVDGRPIFKAS